jgi:putative NIF3 family GTP cyclohydrolase 1 type 2
VGDRLGQHRGPGVSARFPKRGVERLDARLGQSQPLTWWQLHPNITVDEWVENKRTDPAGDIRACHVMSLLVRCHRWITSHLERAPTCSGSAQGRDERPIVKDLAARFARKDADAVITRRARSCDYAVHCW